MHYFRAALRLLPALLLAFALLGCDSGGDNGGDPLSGDLTYQVEGPSETSVGVSEEYFWLQDGDPECLAGRATNKTVPVDEGLGVSEVSNCDRDPDDFDGAQVTVTPTDVDLTVKILSDGDVVEETSEPTTTEQGSEAYRVSVGETIEISDLQ